MANDGPKSAYEIAMERLRAQDVREGVEQRPVTDEQKTAIAEVRNFYDAKLAQDDVMHKSALVRILDPEARAALQAEYNRERQRLIAERDGKIERIRSGG
jgi:hypothetical protein